MICVKISGFQKTSLVDYPDKIVSTIFTSGCNFRCGFCHNPELVTGNNLPLISEQEIINHLKQHKNFLDGICITGGEPTLHQDLPEFIKKIKQVGFLVKLDTNGTNPEMLESLIKNNLIDYIAMDIKAPIEKYKEIVNVEVSTGKIQKSIEFIQNSGIDYEFRTTLLPDILNKKDMLKIAEWLKGSKKYYIQQFRSGKTLDPKFQDANPYTLKELKEFKELMSPFFEVCEVRES